MKFLTKHYCVIEEDGLFFIFREEFLFNRFSLCGEKIGQPFDNLVNAELRLEEILNPKNIELV